MSVISIQVLKVLPIDYDKTYEKILLSDSQVGGCIVTEYVDIISLCQR